MVPEFWGRRKVDLGCDGPKMKMEWGGLNIIAE